MAACLQTFPVNDPLVLVWRPDPDPWQPQSQKQLKEGQDFNTVADKSDAGEETQVL